MNIKLAKKFPLKILWVVLLFAGGWINNMAFAQSPVIKTSVDKNEILIGQQIHFRVEISFPQNKYLLKWFSLPEKMNGFEVVSRDEIDSSTSSGINTFGQTLVLTNFDSGRRHIPAMAFSISSPEDGNQFSMLTDSVLIEVKFSPLDNVQPFHDIKSIIEVKNEWVWWVWALLATGIILFLTGLIYLIKYFNKKKASSDFQETKVPPYEEALQALEHLEKDKLLEKGRIKEFHLKLSDIFKRYLSRKLKSNKMHLTTEEVLMELNDAGLHKDQISSLSNSLQIGNAVKFAQFMPPATESRNCLLEVKNRITDINQFLNKIESHVG